MDEYCEKLSPLIEQKSGQVLSDYLKDLYPIYEMEIANGSFSFHGKPVHVFTELNMNLQHQTFEHLTTKGNTDRLYNTKRCERLVWIRDILADLCNGCTNYHVFRDTKVKTNKNPRYIIWCTKEDYVIVLEERQKDVMLITAYCVLYPNKRRELEDKYQKSLKK